MALQGDLTNMPLADVLQSLKANAQTGTLTVASGSKSLHLFFKRDQVVHVSPGTDTEDYLSPVLLARFELNEDDLARRLSRRRKLTIDKALQKAKVCEAGVVDHLHMLYLIEYLYDAFTWKKGSFAFSEGASPDESFDRDQLAVTLTMNLESTIMESMRRQDEWKQIRRRIPTMNDVFIVSDLFKSQMVQVTEPAQSILGMCDGAHSVSWIAYALGLERFAVAHVVAEHLKTNYLRRVNAEDFASLADQHLERGDTDGALRYFRRSVELDGTSLEVRSRFAEVCRSTGAAAEATSEYKTLAQIARERDDIVRARAYYEILIEMNPAEHQVQQKLYDMLREHRAPDASDIGLALAANYRRMELRGEEAAHLRTMVQEDRANPELLELLGDAEAAQGDTADAADHFRQAARLVLDSGDTAGACARYEKVLSVAPDDTRTTRLLEELRAGVYHERRERRRRVAALVVTALVGSAVVVYALYNAIATRAYIELRNANLIHVATGNESVVPGSILEFVEAYPHALVLLDIPRYQESMSSILAKPGVVAPRADTPE